MDSSIHDEHRASPPRQRPTTSSRRAAAAASLDLVGILVFVAIGRSAHTDGVTIAGMSSTAWPFLVGATSGWIVARVWRAPVSIVPSGVTIWLCCVVIGMVLRVLAGQGTKPAFIVVALVFLALFLVGWRGVAALVERSRRRSILTETHTGSGAG